MREGRTDETNTPTPLRAGRAYAVALVGLKDRRSYPSTPVEERGVPLQPRALACLVPRDSELAPLLRSLIKLSPRPPPLLTVGGTLGGVAWLG